MMNTYSDFISKFKNQTYLPTAGLNASEILFQLNFDDRGGYIITVDAKKREETEPYYLFYSGVTRRIIRIIEEERKKQAVTFTWKKNNIGRVYLHENEQLIKELIRSKKLINKSYQLITSIEGNSELKLFIEGDNLVQTKLVLLHEDKVYDSLRFISPSYVLSGSELFKTANLGTNFYKLPDFEIKFEKEKLQEFLSILFSTFDNISLIYGNYTVVNEGLISSRPTILIKNVDGEKALHLKLCNSLGNFDPDFLVDFQVNHIAVINNFENKILVSEVQYQEVSELTTEITRTFNKYRSLLDSKNNYYVIDGVYIIEENLAKEFIFKELANFSAKYAVFGTDILKSYNVKTVVPRLRVSLATNIDYLEGDAEIVIDEETFSLAELLNTYNQGTYIRLSDGTNAIINKNYIDKLKRLFKKQKNKIQFSFFDLPVIDELIDEKIANEYFLRSRDVFMGFNNIEELEIPLPEIKASLRNYQLKGYKWLKYLHQNKFGGCLADDMGLGKTIQALALLGSFYPEQQKSSLIIMPKSLLFNWENEINKFTPELTYYIFYGENRNIKEAMGKNIILTTYTMIRNEIHKFREENFYYIVLDESQNIKNVNSQISRAVNLISAEHRISLSGTPIENNLSELYSLFRFLNPSMFGSYEEFNKGYAVPIQKENNAEVSNELRRKIYPFVLRRLKKDVLKELPDKVEQTLLIDMSEEQKHFYEQKRLFYYHSIKDQINEKGIKKSQFYILQAMSDLRQIASIPEAKSENQIISPKREVLIENIKEVIANDHKVLVFANFLHAIEIIAQDLQKQGIEYLVMTGATKDRKSLVEKFQGDKIHKVFLMTLKTGGIGLNLTAADYVFIFDPWWNKAAENQAVDRSHRIGQDKTVFSYKMITRGTIEEKILKLQERKEELFNNIISADGASMKTLDETDVEFILGS